MFARQGFGRLAMSFSFLRRSILTLLALVAFGVAAPLRAQELAPSPDVPPTVSTAPWQDVISGQIQAFRDHDAPVAFSYAGAGFQVTYPSAEAFFAAIVTSGYAPIMESKSHSFGAFEMLGETGVVQEVKFTGLDQSLHRAVYQLTEEPAGWRVQGVQLVREAGIAI
jgi:hypothetical protein